MHDIIRLHDPRTDSESVLYRPPGLEPMALQHFLAKRFKPRAQLLSPWLPERGLAMIYGPRGLGKTHLALAVAYAVASGGGLFGWTAPKARKTLYVDGELPAAALQDLINFTRGSAPVGQPEPHLSVLSDDLSTDGLPDLSTADGQSFYNRAAAGFDLIVIDNLSALARTGIENDAESWGSIQQWSIAQRRAGRSVLFIHHAGKGGQQRGTSRREDVLDSVIALRRPEDADPEQGCRFEVHFEKSRGFFGKEAAPLEAWRETGGFNWRPLTDARQETIGELRSEGLTVREIAARTGLSKSAVDRILKRDRA